MTVDRTPYVSAGVAGAVLDTLIAVMRQAVEEGHTIDLPTFGRFRVVPSAARPGFNPSTRERVVVPAKNRVRFAPDPTLKTPPLVCDN